VAARDVWPTAGVRSPAKSGPAPLQRPGPDTEGEVHSVLLHRNPRGAEQAPVAGLIRNPLHARRVSRVGHERVHTPRQETSCPECGGSARRSFALFRELREVTR
jgi:hypothetical protein